MGIPVRQLSPALAFSLGVLTTLPACGSGTGPPADTSTNPALATTSVLSSPLTAPSRHAKRWVDLDVGDCLTDPLPIDPAAITVTIVDCTTAHTAEVYLRAPVPVDAALADVADRQCDGAFAHYTGQLLGGSSFRVAYLVDSNQDRTASNPFPSTVICLLHAAAGRPVAGTARR